MKTEISDRRIPSSVVGLSGFERFSQELRSPALLAVSHQWNRARRNRNMPSWFDLSPEAFAPQFSLLWGFHLDRETGEFVGRLAGSNIREWLGTNFWGGKLRDIHPKVAKEAHQFMSNVLSGPSAGLCSGNLFKAGEQLATGQRIALPLTSDGKKADGILGATDFGNMPVVGAVELMFENVRWFPL